MRTLAGNKMVILGLCPGCGKPYPKGCDWCSDDYPAPMPGQQVKLIYNRPPYYVYKL